MKSETRLLAARLLALPLLAAAIATDGWCQSLDECLETGQQEFYIVSDYYDKVLGLNADGTTPRLSAYGTNQDADTYVMVVTPTATAGYYHIQNKATGRYLAASTSDTWSLQWVDQVASGSEYDWKMDVQFGGTIRCRKDTSHRLGCDWTEDDYVPVYYDKAASSRCRFTVIPALEGGLDTSLLQARTAPHLGSIGTTETDIYQVAEPMELTEAIDLHIISNAPFTTTGSVNIVNRDAWVIFDNLRPSEVIESYLPYITVGGNPAVNGDNVRVAIYLEGAAVIPASITRIVLRGFSEPDQQGDVLRMRDVNNPDLGNWKNCLRGFVLKRGYMATLATGTEGSGYSRVYVADHADIVVDQLPEQLDRRVSSIHIKPWQYSSKKGWCSTQGNSGIAGGMKSLKATWFYTWSADRSSTADAEYVPIRQHIYWPSMTTISAQTASTNVLGFNEPEHSEQHNTCDCGGAIDSWKATTKTPEMAATGMRIGSPSPTDASWLSEYIGHCNDMTYRCDFVAIHSYWGPNEANGVSAWYNRLKAIYDATKRPIWITEWAYGASWTTESWPSNYSEQLEKNRAAIMDIIDMFERNNFIERYSYYQWDTTSRRLINDDGWMTPAGRVYRDTRSTFGYDASVQYIPHWWKPSTKKPTLDYTIDNEAGEITFNMGNTNGDCTDTFELQRQTDDSEWETLYNVEDRSLLDEPTLTYSLPLDEVDRTRDNYRLHVTTILGGEAYSGKANLGYIHNPDCEDGTNGWTVSNLSTNTGEAYDGDNTNTYWNQWKANGLDSSMSQTLTDLPAGDYQFSALLRSGSNVTITFTATIIRTVTNDDGTTGEERETVTESLNGVGSSTQDNSNYQFGWMLVTLPTVTVAEGDRIELTASAQGSGSAWWSADHFTIDYTAPEKPETDHIDRTQADKPADNVYDLTGRRIAPDQMTEKSIYVVGNKKVKK